MIVSFAASLCLILRIINMKSQHYIPRIVLMVLCFVAVCCGLVLADSPQCHLGFLSNVGNQGEMLRCLSNFRPIGRHLVKRLTALWMEALKFHEFSDSLLHKHSMIILYFRQPCFHVPNSTLFLIQYFSTLILHRRSLDTFHKHEITGNQWTYLWYILYLLPSKRKA